jgi:hypothetical protein
MPGCQRGEQLIILVVAIAMGGGAAYLARSWLQPDSRHKLRNAGQVFATNRETRIFAAKYA